MKKIRTVSLGPGQENKLRKNLVKLFKKCPIPEDELFSNIGLFLSRHQLSRILFINDIYKNILNSHGVVMEFGVRWGQNMGLFEALRGVYEPFNLTRKIIGFDTFEGFPSVHEKDGNDNIASKGGYGVTKNYEKYLKQILDYHEKMNPNPHVKKYELVKGNAINEIDKYFKKHPETIIALAYFDFDLYEPTKKCLEAIKSRLSKGSIIAFDELNSTHFPGETLALKEVFGLNKFKIIRSPYSQLQSYVVFK